MRIAAASVLSLLVFVVADAADAATRPRLKAFDDCRSLVDYARSGALRTQGGVGVDGRAAPPMVDAVVTPQIAPPPRRAGRRTTPRPARRCRCRRRRRARRPAGHGPGVLRHQRAGGRRRRAGHRQDRRAADLRRHRPHAAGRRPGVRAGDRERSRSTASGTGCSCAAIACWSSRRRAGSADSPEFARPVAPTIAPVSSATIVTELDVSDRHAEGDAHDGGAGALRRRAPERRHRAAGDRLRAGAVHRDPQETVSEQVRDARRGDFLQRTVLRSKLSGKTYRRDLAPCKAITHPAQFSGTGVLAILTVDLDRGMYSLDRDGVMAGAQVVYGSDRSLYVASRRYVRALELGQDVPEGVRTEIHRFDISNPGAHDLSLDRHGPGLHPQQLRAVRVRRPPAGGVDRGAAMVPGRHAGRRARARSRCSRRTARGWSGSGP